MNLVWIAMSFVVAMEMLMKEYHEVNLDIDGYRDSDHY